jgi:outer membrane protein assembly factor BamB
LIVAAVSSHQAGTDRINRTKGKLTALDAQTGRVLWTAELADSL